MQLGLKGILEFITKYHILIHCFGRVLEGTSIVVKNNTIFSNMEICHGQHMTNNHRPVVIDIYKTLIIYN